MQFAAMTPAMDFGVTVSRDADGWTITTWAPRIYLTQKILHGEAKEADLLASAHRAYNAAVGQVATASTTATKSKPSSTPAARRPCRSLRITYAVDRETGLVWSRVDSELAFPVLDYDKIGEGGDFSGPLTYHLEKCPVYTMAGPEWDALRWTRKIPLAAKNLHREFWGMKALKESG